VTQFFFFFFFSSGDCTQPLHLAMQELYPLSPTPGPCLQVYNWSYLLEAQFFFIQAQHTLQNHCDASISFVYNFLSKIYVEACSISDQNLWPNLSWKLFLFLLLCLYCGFQFCQVWNLTPKPFSWQRFLTSRSGWCKTPFKSHYPNYGMTWDMTTNHEGETQCQDMENWDFVNSNNIVITRLSLGVK
jgi:hypothetical protein